MNAAGPIAHLNLHEGIAVLVRAQLFVGDEVDIVDRVSVAKLIHKASAHCDLPHRSDPTTFAANRLRYYAVSLTSSSGFSGFALEMSRMLRVGLLSGRNGAVA